MHTTVWHTTVIVCLAAREIVKIVSLVAGVSLSIAGESFRSVKINSNGIQQK
jgi:hypothetical protein